MSKTFRSFEQVSQHFKCPVHIGKLKDPRRLPCEHTICKDCLKGVIKTALSKDDNNATFLCPECRERHHIPDTETEDWADWFPIDAFCVIQLKTLARFQDSQVCEVHVDKFKEYYCFHHRDLFCPDCVIEKHTKAPCYSRNSKDAVNDVRKHINDLIGQLRLQEERAKRVSESKIAAAHIDELQQKVWEMDHMIERFYKTMKKKMEEARSEIENATKITQADKVHMKTVQALITQTKHHVEELLKTVNTKTQEGQNDILRLWKPLDDEVENFGTVLNAVEKKPFCVNVTADEHFLDLISVNQQPLVVVNDSAQWTPHSTVSRATSEKSQAHSSLSKYKYHGLKEMKKSLKELKEQTPRSTKENDATGNLSYRSLPTLDFKRPSYELPYKKKTDMNAQTARTDRYASVQLPSIKSTVIPTGETSRTFNIKNLRLRGISLQSTFEFPCEDIIVLENNILTITERAVQKFSVRYQFIQSLPLRAPLKLASVRDTNNVLVLDNSNMISLVSTTPRLQLLYRIETDRTYTNLCHMRTTTTEDQYGRSLYHMHLSLTHMWSKEDCVDQMVVSFEKNSLAYGLMEEIVIKPAKVKTVVGSNDEPMLKNITSICTGSDNRKVLVGAENGVVCLGRNGEVIWNYHCNFVSSVDVRKGLVFIAIEAEKRILIVDQHGTDLVDNIIPAGCKYIQPSRISVGKSSMIVREFSRREMKSMVHVLNLSFA